MYHNFCKIIHLCDYLSRYSDLISYNFYQLHVQYTQTHKSFCDSILICTFVICINVCIRIHIYPFFCTYYIIGHRAYTKLSTRFCICLENLKWTFLRKHVNVMYWHRQWKGITKFHFQECVFAPFQNIFRVVTLDTPCTGEDLCVGLVLKL